jgi:hypothetical protein
MASAQFTASPVTGPTQVFTESDLIEESEPISDSQLSPSTALDDSGELVVTNVFTVSQTPTPDVPAEIVEFTVIGVDVIVVVIVAIVVVVRFVKRHRGVREDAVLGVSLVGNDRSDLRDFV